jgi:hypothetical protein
MLRKLMGLLVCTLFVCAATAAVADVPDLELSQATFDAGNPPAGVTLVLWNLPGATGNPFTDARGDDGNDYDATIQLLLRNADNQPIPDFPQEDMWILPTPDAAGNFFACTNGTIADNDTDDAGRTQWQLPMNAGGFTDLAADITQCYISGAALVGPGLALGYNSCDLTGDGNVNLSDIGLFSQDFYGAYNFRSDFIFDGILNLSDIGLLAQGNGSGCP